MMHLSVEGLEKRVWTFCWSSMAAINFHCTLTGKVISVILCAVATLNMMMILLRRRIMLRATLMGSSLLMIITAREAVGRENQCLLERAILS